MSTLKTSTSTALTLRKENSQRVTKTNSKDRVIFLGNLRNINFPILPELSQIMQLSQKMTSTTWLQKYLLPFGSGATAAQQVRFANALKILRQDVFGSLAGWTALSEIAAANSSFSKTKLLEASLRQLSAAMTSPDKLRAILFLSGNSWRILESTLRALEGFCSTLYPSVRPQLSLLDILFLSPNTPEKSGNRNFGEQLRRLDPLLWNEIYFLSGTLTSAHHMESVDSTIFANLSLEELYSNPRIFWERFPNPTGPRYHDSGGKEGNPKSHRRRR